MWGVGEVHEKLGSDEARKQLVKRYGEETPSTEDVDADIVYEPRANSGRYMVYCPSGDVTENEGVDQLTTYAENILTDADVASVDRIRYDWQNEQAVMETESGEEYMEIIAQGEGRQYVIGTVDGIDVLLYRDQESGENAAYTEHGRIDGWNQLYARLDAMEQLGAACDAAEDRATAAEQGKYTFKEGVGFLQDIAELNVDREDVTRKVQEDIIDTALNDLNAIQKSNGDRQPVHSFRDFVDQANVAKFLDGYGLPDVAQISCGGEYRAWLVDGNDVDKLGDNTVYGLAVVDKSSGNTGQSNRKDRINTHEDILTVLNNGR